MPTKKQIIIGLLCVVVFGLGYWSGLPEKDSGQRTEADTPPVPTIITNVVTNVVKEVVTNTVMVHPPVPEKADFSPIVEKEIRLTLGKPAGEFTDADLEKVTRLNLSSNQLTDVKGLEKLNQLTELGLHNNPDLTKAQIAELQKALPNCKILHNVDK